MELDINTDWVNFSTYAPSSPNGAASPANGNETAARRWSAPPRRYFEPWWSRDFITMSARFR